MPSQTLRDEFKSVFGGALSTLAALADAEARLGSLEGGGGGDGGGAEGDKMAAMEVALEDMAKLQEQARRQDAYAIDAKVDRVLGQMGFMPDEAALPVASFSGGWKMRIGLGKILLSDPNLLLLDEPTNHLDLESVGVWARRSAWRSLCVVFVLRRGVGGGVNRLVFSHFFLFFNMFGAIRLF